MATILGVKVKKIIIYPLGGLSKFQMDYNIHPVKEFFILISGPIFQFIAFFLLKRIFPESDRVISIYHYNILFFNLLPIVPLDGGKLFNILIESVLPYHFSKRIMILISYIIVLILIIKNPLSINIIITIIWLILLIAKEQKKIEVIYEKFLLERFLKNYRFKRIKVITKEKNFYRNKKHIIKQENTTMFEKDYLNKKYKKIEKSY